MAVRAEDDKHLMFVPLDALAEPKSGIVECIKDHYWLKHPTKGFVIHVGFRGRKMPQCNRDVNVTTRIRDVMYPWAEIEKVPVAYVKGTT